MSAVPISVLLPVYNGEPYLVVAVESILAQTFADFEFLIIDDASTDSTWPVLESYAAHDARIHLVRHERNRGIACALNSGLAIAQGRYVTIMHADDFSVPRRLALQVGFMDAHPSVGVLGSAIHVMDRAGRRTSTVRSHSEDGVLRWVLCFHSPVWHPTVMARRELMLSVRGYRADYEPAEDRDLWQRMSRLTRLANLREVLLDYREHPARLSHREREKLIRNSAHVSQRIAADLLGKAIPFDVCYQIRRGSFDSSADAWAAGRLISDLYEAYCQRMKLSRPALRAIRNDVARRLCRLAWSRRRERAAMRLLVNAFRLHARSAALSIGRQMIRSAASAPVRRD